MNLMKVPKLLGLLRLGQMFPGVVLEKNTLPRSGAHGAYRQRMCVCEVSYGVPALLALSPLPGGRCRKFCRKHASQKAPEFVIWSFKNVRVSI